MTDNVSAEALRRDILAALPDGSKVTVEGDSQHYSICAVSPEFADKSRLQQHRLIHAALGESLKAIHSVSIQTFTTEQWQARKGLLQA